MKAKKKNKKKRNKERADLVGRLSSHKAKKIKGKKGHKAKGKMVSIITNSRFGPLSLCLSVHSG